jgi:hypothetical protein
MVFRMSITRTEAELQTAIETMFRVRAVESPPDEQGARTIWHRGHKGADLVTWVDAFGRVTRQELYLFHDCMVWEKASGVRTGESRDTDGSILNPSPDTIAFDEAANDGRIIRVRKALELYSGADKFILHARQLVGGEEELSDEVTRSAQAITDENLRSAVEKKLLDDQLAAVRRKRMMLMIAGCMLIGAAMLIWILELWK